MKTTPLALIALTAGIACANPVFAPEHSEVVTDDPSRHHDSVTFDLTGVQFMDSQGSAFNEIWAVHFGFLVQVTGVSWDVNLTTVGASWASEATIDIAGLFDIVVSDDANPVTNQNYTSNGIFEFSENGISDINIFDSQPFYFEFYETFDDNTGFADAFFEAGSTITFHGKGLPTPGTLAILSLGGLTASRRRR